MRRIGSVRVRLALLWERLGSSLWFVPGAIVLAAMALAVMLVELSAVVDDEVLVRIPRLFGAGAAGSREMLSTIAGSVITVAGVTFSITIVAVAQASTQYTPRILRNFMRDRPNQVVLGTFLGIYAYCLVVLRTIRDVEELLFIPRVAVFVGFALALLGVGVLVFFIHHIATTLQASAVIERVARDTIAAVDHLFPDALGEDAGGPERDGAPAALGGASWRPVPARATGYIESVDADGLMAFARAHDLVVRMERGVGDFVVEATPIASLAAPPGVAGDLADEVNALYAVSAHRTVQQDAAFGVRQIVDIALKALSPGVNDTTTALTCVDYLTSVLARLAPRRIDGPVRSEGGVVRVIARGASFGDLLSAAFDDIRRSAEENPAVLLRMLDAIETIGSRAAAAARRRALSAQVDLIVEAAERREGAPHDRLAIEARATSVRDALTQALAA